MNIRIDLASILEQGFTKSQIEERLVQRLGLKDTAAAMRLDRAIDPQSRSINRDLLAELLTIASEQGIEFEKLLRLERGGVFDLLPGDSTLTYIGAYGPTPDAKHRTGSAIVTSVFDHFAARRCARKITRDFSKLRFARSLLGKRTEIVNYARREAKHAEENEHSILSLGSGKPNTMSEWIIAAALGLAPFENPPSSAGSMPFVYVFPHQYANLAGNEPELLDRATVLVVDDAKSKHAYVRWNAHEFPYRPARPPRDADHGEQGIDYAIVFVHAHLGKQRRIGHIVAGGLSGVGTYGAAALLCDHPEMFVMPTGQATYVRAFLLEIEFDDSEPDQSLRKAARGRMISRWTQQEGAQGEFADAPGSVTDPIDPEWKDIKNL